MSIRDQGRNMNLQFHGKVKYLESKNSYYFKKDLSSTNMEGTEGIGMVAFVRYLYKDEISLQHLLA